MSSSSLGVFGCIDELPGPVDRLHEVGIAHRTGRDEVDAPAIERLERLLQSEVAIEQARTMPADT
jgi:hypothetical protein